MLGLVLLMLVSSGVLHYIDSFDEADPTARLNQRIVEVTRAVEAKPAADRQSYLDAADQLPFGVSIESVPTADLGSLLHPAALILRTRLEHRLGANHEVKVGAARPPAPTPGVQDRGMVVEVRLVDGSWLKFSIATPEGVISASPSRFVERIFFVGVLILLLSIWTARRLASPIAEFAAAAERLGKDTDAPPIAEKGPAELRMAIRAFNQMQERLQRNIRDRTQMLAAMSHDLRTPLTRMRLRTELMEAGEIQNKMRNDLDEMTKMVATTLTFAREEFSQEPRQRIDLKSLIENVCESAIDMGASVSYSCPDNVELDCRPIALQRAVTNVLDNAISYGKCAYLSVVPEDRRVVIVFEDDGPGIPVEEQQKVFDPFYRLEPSRSRETGGVGLGLTLVRIIVHSHGGDVGLMNRTAGGLCVTLTLPAG